MKKEHYKQCKERCMYMKSKFKIPEGTQKPKDHKPIIQNFY